MSRRTVREVMTTEVLAVAVDTPVTGLTGILAATGFRTLPVLDGADRVVGRVATADLASTGDLPAARRADGGARAAAPGRPRPGQERGPRVARWIRRSRRGGPGGSGPASALDLVRPAVTISPDAAVAEAAQMMYRHQVAELVVTDACGHLRGIVSWADLGHVFLRPDSDLTHAILRDVFVRYLGTDPALVRVSVTEGVVTLSGVVAKRAMIPLAAAMSRSVDGVVAVRNDLGCAEDDPAAEDGGAASSVPDLTGA